MSRSSQATVSMTRWRHSSLRLNCQMLVQKLDQHGIVVEHLFEMSAPASARPGCSGRSRRRHDRTVRPTPSHPWWWRRSARIAACRCADRRATSAVQHGDIWGNFIVAQHAAQEDVVVLARCAARPGPGSMFSCGAAHVAVVELLSCRAHGARRSRPLRACRSAKARAVSIRTRRGRPAGPASSARAAGSRPPRRARPRA